MRKLAAVRSACLRSHCLRHNGGYSYAGPKSSTGFSNKGSVAIADDEELDEAQERPGVAVVGVVFVIDDLLHGPARVDAERLQLDLRDRHAVDEQNDVVTVVAVEGRIIEQLRGTSNRGRFKVHFKDVTPTH